MDVLTSNWAGVSITDRRMLNGLLLRTFAGLKRGHRMSQNKKPRHLAVLGALEIDQLGSKVDPEISLRGLIPQPPQLRAGIPKTISTLPKNNADTIAMFARVFVGGQSKLPCGSPLERRPADFS
jgi:hypothetical protein